jgi:hypothetical protein
MLCALYSVHTEQSRDPAAGVQEHVLYIASCKERPSAKSGASIIH